MSAHWSSPTTRRSAGSSSGASGSSEDEGATCYDFAAWRAPTLGYALSGDVHVAYRLFGEGPFDLVFAGGLEYPSIEFHDHAIGAGFDELTDRMRVIRFDKRGTGVSDRVTGVPSLEERMDDVRAVLDAVSSERAVLLGLRQKPPSCR